LRGLSDQLVATTRTRRPAGGLRDDDRLPQFDPELAMGFEAVPRLQDRRVRELPVQLRDAAVGAVVGAAVEADRSVDAMHDPAPARRPALEQVRVQEDAPSAARNRAVADPQPAAMQLTSQGE